MKSLTLNMSLKFFSSDLEDSKGEATEVELDNMAIIGTTSTVIRGFQKSFWKFANSGQINRKNLVNSSGNPSRCA